MSAVRTGPNWIEVEDACPVAKIFIRSEGPGVVRVVSGSGNMGGMLKLFHKAEKAVKGFWAKEGSGDAA